MPYGFHDAINVSENFMIPEPENSETLTPKPSVPLLVLLFLYGMLTAIDFYNNSCLKTYKIHDIGP